MQDKQTILIVDDIEENVDVLVQLLDKYDLITSLSGTTALSIVEEEDIDLILLDIMMPHVDGFEVCKTLKQNPKTSHIPVIFLSARDEYDDIQAGFDLGAVDYVTKPFNPKELLSRIQTHLKLRAYEKDLEKQVTQELEKNKIKEQMIHQQSKQAALGELLMHIAHQWKQPLASLASIHLLQRTKIEENMPFSNEELLQQVSKSEELIHFMSDTVDTFRDFYQPTILEKSFSLTDAINNVLHISNATLNYNNIQITLSSDEKVLTVGNVNEFTQVIFSIINNAYTIFKLRHISQPKLLITVNDSKVSIEDNAGGIDKEILPNIFLPFTSTTNGNGIGLYIAKEVVEKNSGIISVTNTQDGALFIIEYLTWIS